MSSAAVARPPLVPPIFTRVNGPTLWPIDALYPPLDPAQQRERYLRALILAVAPALESSMRVRFGPTPYRIPWNPLPALPRFNRGPFATNELTALNDTGLCQTVKIEAGLIDRTLDAPAEMTGGLARNHLLATHAVRLRQLWAEFERRDWPEGSVNAFRSALGVAWLH